MKKFYTLLLLVFSITFHAQITLPDVPDTVMCDDNNDESATFNLSAYDAMLLEGLDTSGYSVAYYLTYADAEMDINPLPPVYNNISNPQTVFAKVWQNSNTNNYGIALFSLRVNPSPVINGEITPLTSCGQTIDLTTNGELFSEWQAEYYISLPDAQNGTNQIINPTIFEISAPGSAWIKLINPITSCYSIIEQPYRVATAFTLTATSIAEDTISIIINGGVSPFTYTIITAPSSVQVPVQHDNGVFPNLPPGAYTFMVSDACGYAATITQHLLVPPSGERTQTFVSGQKLSDLNVTGDNLKWYDNDQLTTEIPDTTLITNNTTYYVTQTINGVVSPPLAITARLAAGIDDNIAGFTYSPNPVNDILTISADTGINRIEVYNLLGQLSLSQNNDSATASISLSLLQPGMYIIKTYSISGNTTIKIIKE